MDHRSDIFSFGVVLYEMVSGKRAFRGESSVETMNAILKEDVPELTAPVGPVSPGLDRIVHRCLEKKPERRFQSASESWNWQAERSRPIPEWNTPQAPKLPPDGREESLSLAIR